MIRAVAEAAESLFAVAEIEFPSLWGRPLQLIDCQNLFCETDKYSRVAHPELRGRSGRTQIKQRYVPSTAALSAAYPPKWALPCSVIPERLEPAPSDLLEPFATSQASFSFLQASQVALR